MKRSFYLSLMTLLGIVLGGVDMSATVYEYDFEAWAKGYKEVYKRALGDWTQNDVTDWNGIKDVYIDDKFGLGKYGEDNKTYITKTFDVGNNNEVKYEVDWVFAASVAQLTNWNWIQFGDFLRVGINSDNQADGSSFLNVSTDAGYTWKEISDYNFWNDRNAIVHIEVIFNTYEKTVKSFKCSTTNNNGETVDLTGEESIVVGTYKDAKFDVVSIGYTQGKECWNSANFIQSITVSQQALLTSGEQYSGTGYNSYNHWNQIFFDGKLYDTNRFVSKVANNQGWWFGDNGLRCWGYEGKYYPELIITHLLSGDEITFESAGEGLSFIKVTNENGRALKDANDHDGLRQDERISSGTTTIKVTADCDLIIQGTINTVLKKVKITRPDYGDFKIVNNDNNDYSNTFEFTQAGKIVDADRKITEMYGINVELGNPNISNYTEVFDCGNNEYAVRIFDESNWTWLWAEPHTHTIENYYKQGTFYKFEPTISGTLTVKGYCSGSYPLYLECYQQENGKWLWVNPDETLKDGSSGTGDFTVYKEISNDKCKEWSVDLKAGRVYYLYAKIADTYSIKSFTYECKFHFANKSVIVNDDLSVTNVDGSENGKATKSDGNITYKGQKIDATGVTYSVKPIGKIDGKEVKEEDKAATVVVSGDDVIVSWKEKFHGAIVVTGESSDGKAQYVITVPYKTNEWRFYSAAKNDPEDPKVYKEDLYKNPANGKDEWGLTWKIRSFTDKSDKNRQLKYISNSVIASKTPVHGDNARFVNETAGLIIKTKNIDSKDATYGFGMVIGSPNIVTGDPDIENSAIMNAYTLDNTYGREDKDKDGNPLGICDALTIRTGTTLTIPNLKKGQYVRMRWNRYSDRAYGERMIAYNVTDLGGKSMNGKIFFLGSGTNAGQKFGHQEFIVEKDGDVSFELTGEGWTNIYNIMVGEIGEFLTTDLQLRTDGGTPVDKKYTLTSQWREDIYVYKRKADGVEINTPFKSQQLQQSSLYAAYDIANRTGTLNEDNCKMVGNTLTISPNAHGSFTLILKGIHNRGGEWTNNDYTEVEDDYMLDSIHAEVRVFEYDYRKVDYPHTWAMEHFTTDTRPNDDTLYKIDNDGQYWEEGETKDDLKRRIFRVGYPENMIALKRREINAIEPLQTITYSLKEDEAFAAGTTVNMGAVALTYGVKGGASFVASKKDTDVDGYEYVMETGNGENGKADEGTVYIINPLYKGTIDIAVIHSDNNKPLYITEDGRALEGYDGKTVEKKYKGIYTFDVKAGKTYRVYATGTRLGFYGFSYTYNIYEEEFIPEFDGLGFIPVDYDDNRDTNVQLEPTQNGIILSGGKGYQLIVPNVRETETVYLAVTGDTDESSVTNEDTKAALKREAYTGSVWVDTYINNEETEYKDYNYENGFYYKDDENNPIHIYKIQGNGGDVNLLLKDLTVHKVAVSVDTKNVTEVGYATEAREYPLDFTLARLFLGKEQKAYKVIDVKKKEGSQPNVELSEVRYIPATTEENKVGNPKVNNGVIITGYDIENGNKVKGGTIWPLFTTDIDRATSDMSRNNLVGVIEPTATDDKNKIIDQKDNINDTDYYNYLLATGGFKVEYEEDNRTDAQPSDRVTGFETGLGFYLVLAKGTKLGENVQLSEAEQAEFGEDGYKGGLPQPHSAYLKLTQRLAQINEFDEDGKNYSVNAAKVHQVFFIDTDSLLTDIDEVLIDDEDLLSTEEKNSANVLKNGVFYTLQGIPVKNPTKGIYIFNGKKVYVK